MLDLRVDVGIGLGLSRTWGAYNEDLSPFFPGRSPTLFCWVGVTVSLLPTLFLQGLPPCCVGKLGCIL